MKIKIIKRDDIKPEENSSKSVSPRRKIYRAVEKWVTDLKTRTEAESRLSFEQLFRQPDKRCTKV